MISSVLLLSPKMFHSSISDILLKTNEHINVRCCETLAELTLTSDDIFKQSRLISFLNDLIVPSLILNKFKYGGFNFHPGLPSHPGHAPFSFALYDGSLEHGVTLHRMIDKVDAGRIVVTRSFPIPPTCNQLELINLSIEQAAKLLAEFASMLVFDTELNFTCQQWSTNKTTKALFAQRCKIELDISLAELQRLIRAFGSGDGISLPYLMINGEKYIYQQSGLPIEDRKYAYLHDFLFIAT